MTKKQVRVLAIVLALVVLLAAALVGLYLSGRSYTYSEERHLKRIASRIENRFMREGSEYTGFEIYPVYNEREEFEFALVEFAPQGFLYVVITEWEIPFLGVYMYSMSDPEPTPWSPCRMEEEIGPNGLPLEGIYQPSFFVDENGEQIYYNESHFKVAGIQNERRYLLDCNGLIPAVKRGENLYLDLVDGALIEYDPADEEHDYPTYTPGEIWFHYSLTP